MNIDLCKEEEFRKVYLQHVEHVRNFLYYKSGNLSLAEDLAQDAFAKLWENCAKVVLDKAKSFVFTVASNLFKNEIKHQKVVLKFNSKPSKDRDLEDPQFQMEHEEFKLRLETAIGNLPEGQRVVFLMNRIDKKTYREIADELGLSVKAIEKRMHLALKALRAIYKK